MIKKVCPEVYVYNVDGDPLRFEEALSSSEQTFGEKRLTIKWIP